jgi:hypothetical protein
LTRGERRSSEIEEDATNKQVVEISFVSFRIKLHYDESGVIAVDNTIDLWDWRRWIYIKRRK